MKRIYLFAAALLVTAIVATSALAQTRPATPAPRPTPAPAQTPAPRPTPAPAQTPAPPVAVPPTKIAFIDTSMFNDERYGIARWVAQMKVLEREFQGPQAELTNLQNRIKAIADEINKLSASPAVDPRSIQAKRDEGARLQRDGERKKEDYDALFEKRYAEVMNPLRADIGKALDQFAVQHGITMTLDVSKMGPALLTAIPASDVTQAFIADYNSKNPAPRP